MSRGGQAGRMGVSMNSGVLRESLNAAIGREADTPLRIQPHSPCLMEVK